MGLFTTRQLLGYTEQKVKFNPLFLSLFFRRTVTFPTQEVMLDKITGKTPIPGRGVTSQTDRIFGPFRLTRNRYDYVARNFSGGRAFPVRFIFHCCRCR